MPQSPYESIYRAIFCGEKLLDPQNLIKSSGMIHLFIISAFEVYLIHLVAKIMFHKNRTRNLFLVVSLFIFLALTAFHPTSLRAAVLLLLKEVNFQFKLFWSPLQLAIFAGFVCISLQNSLFESGSLLIGWTASIAYAYFFRHRAVLKNSAVYIFLLPLLKGMIIPHPLLALFFSFTSRTILVVLFPLCILFCFIPALHFWSETFWQNVFSLAFHLEQFFLPVRLGSSLNISQCWLYLLSLMAVFLYLERKRLSQC